MTHTIPDRQADAPPPGPPPAESLRLLEMLTGSWISQSLYIVARFDIADRISGGARMAGDIAAEAGLDPLALFRIMRALASVGIFSQNEDETFGLTELGRYLTSDVPGTQKYSAILFGEETFRSWAEIRHTARTGEPAFETVYGESFYDYLEQHPDASAVFNRVMGVSGAVPLARAFDFSPYREVVDVGGGVGALLTDILQTHSHLSGTIVDLAEAAGEAERQIAAAGLASRCRYQAGSFFGNLPSDGDVYLLSRVLHNWHDEDAARILANVRTAIAPHGRLLILERFLPAGDEFHMGKIFDLVMMVMLGGRERTAEEYGRLLSGSGFGVVEQLSGPAGIGILVAEPVRSAE